MGSKHVNIPIFIPHLGCPNNCVFCNQHTISGHGEFELARARREIDEALSTIGEGVPTEIAFFGGSFTGIERELMIALLELAEEYVPSSLDFRALTTAFFRLRAEATTGCARLKPAER